MDIKPDVYILRRCIKVHVDGRSDLEQKGGERWVEGGSIVYLGSLRRETIHFLVYFAHSCHNILFNNLRRMSENLLNYDYGLFYPVPNRDVQQCVYRYVWTTMGGMGTPREIRNLCKISGSCSSPQRRVRGGLRNL